MERLELCIGEDTLSYSVVKTAPRFCPVSQERLGESPAYSTCVLRRGPRGQRLGAALSPLEAVILTRLQGLAGRGSQHREKSDGVHGEGTPVTSAPLPLAKPSARPRLTSGGQGA